MSDPTHKPMVTQSAELKKLLAEQRITPRWVRAVRPFGPLVGSLLLVVAVLLGIRACAVKASAATLDLDRLIPALEQVESAGDPSAIGDNGRALGVLQIWDVVVADVNRAKGTRYTHADALDPVKARAICRAYLSIYCTQKRLGRAPTMEDAARIWNGGPNGHRKAATVKYWQKVARAL